MSTKRKIFSYYFHTFNTQSMPDYINLYQSESLSPSSVPFHNILSSVWSIALDIQHFLKPFCRFWWDVLPCRYDPHWLNTTFIFLGLRNYLNPWSFTIFSIDGVSAVEKLNASVLDFCVVSVVWSVWVQCSCHVFLTCGFVQVLFWVMQLIFNFPVAIFLLLPLH